MYEIIAEISTEGCSPGTLAPITVTALNDNGVAVGFLFDCAFNAQPFMWSQEMGFVAIPLPPGATEARPMDVNNRNEIIGFLVRPDLGAELGFHWNDGVWTELPLLPGFPIARANAISDDGLIVGEAFNPFSSEPFRAVKWETGAILELQLPVGPNSYATDINHDASIVGLMGDALTTTSLGFLQQDEIVQEIPPVEGSTSSEARAVNMSNVTTGLSFLSVKSASIPRRSWIFRDGELSDLGVLQEANHSTFAFDINDAGQIVGRSETDGSGLSVRAFLWQNGHIVNLETLVVNPPGFLWLGGAHAINNNGLITAINQAAGGIFILAPVDRPPGDVNIDCTVDEFDLIAVLDDWGPDKLGHLTDMVTRETFAPPGDGQVDAADLAFVLGNWSSSGPQSLPTRR